MDWQNPRTNGKSKAIKTKSQTEAYTYSQKEKKGKKYVYRCSQSPPPQFGVIRCLFRYSTDAGTSSWLWRFNPLLLRLLGEISLSLLCSHSSWGSALDLARSSLRQDGVKGAADSVALAHSGWGEGGVWMQASLRRQRVAWCCTSVRRTVRSPREVVPGSRDPGSGGLHRLPGGEEWRVTCAHTQASWWRQQQP